MLFYLSRLKSLHFCYFEGLKMDFLQFQYFQFTKSGFSPLKNFKNVIRRSEIVESCYFYEKIKKQPLKTFWWLRNQGFTNSQTIPVINTWDLFTFYTKFFFTTSKVKAFPMTLSRADETLFTYLKDLGLRT